MADYAAYHQQHPQIRYSQQNLLPPLDPCRNDSNGYVHPTDRPSHSLTPNNSYLPPQPSDAQPYLQPYQPPLTYGPYLHQHPSQLQSRSPTSAMRTSSEPAVQPQPPSSSYYPPQQPPYHTEQPCYPQQSFYTPHRPLIPHHAAPPQNMIPAYSFGASELTQSDLNAPKLGETRCYWALLSSHLTFVFLDPVLQMHMSSQGPLLAARCILDFIHPDEVDSARKDLRQVLDAKEVNGSVTRALGAAPDSLGSFPHQQQIGFDDNYLATDLVINWVAEGLVLCFIHAIVDLAPQDNDECAKTPWTNWCRTAMMDERHSRGLYKALSTPYLMHPPRSHYAQYLSNNSTDGGSDAYPPSPSSPTAVSSPHSQSPAQSASGWPGNSPPRSSASPSSFPDRIFQVLRNDDSRDVMCSYPRHGYDSEEVRKLATNLSLGAHAASGESAAKTTCTRRFYSNGTVADTTTGAGKNVDSIYIPHGCVIFACHKGVGDGAPPQDQASSYDSYATAPPPYQQQQQQMYDVPRTGSGTAQNANYPGYRTGAPPGSYTPPHTAGTTTYSNAQSQYPNGWNQNNQAQTPSASQGYVSQQLPQPLQAPPPGKYPSSLLTQQRPPLLHSHSHSHLQQNYSHYQPLQTSHSSQSLYSNQSISPTSATSPTSQALVGAPSSSSMSNGVQSQSYTHHPSQPQGSNNWPPPTWPADHGSTPPTATDPTGPPLLRPLDTVTPSSATSSQSIEYPPAYVPVPTSAPPTGQSFFPMGAHSGVRPARSHSVISSPTVVKRTSDEMLYAGSGSGDDGSVSPSGRHGPPHPPSQHGPGGYGHYPQGHPYDGYRHYDVGHADRNVGPQSPQKEDYGPGTVVRPLIPSHRDPSGSRSNGHPPPGVTKCVSCGIDNSPEWRKGESGVKNLCNACGLRYARSKQKKEGHLPQRRKKKDKSGASPKAKKVSKARRKIEDSSSPPASATPGEDDGLKREDSVFYPQPSMYDTAAPTGMDQGHEGYQEVVAPGHYHTQPPSATHSYFPSTQIPDGHSHQYGSYPQVQGYDP
ncbi:hypothetical protein FRB99_005865 [Tulasnella sp. 403]|nr:hypothetical protein FRB99_005865 [Tulasnella sp. 403]